MSEFFGAVAAVLGLILMLYGIVGVEWHFDKMECEAALSRNVQCTWQPPALLQEKGE